MVEGSAVQSVRVASVAVFWMEGKATFQSLLRSATGAPLISEGIAAVRVAVGADAEKTNTRDSYAARCSGCEVGEAIAVPAVSGSHASPCEYLVANARTLVSIG